jgi:hypothetical protein
VGALHAGAGRIRLSQRGAGPAKGRWAQPSMFYLAKLIQALGFADVSYALFVGFTEEHGMGRELKLMVIGVAIFYVGRLLERKASV